MSHEHEHDDDEWDRKLSMHVNRNASRQGMGHERYPIGLPDDAQTRILKRGKWRSRLTAFLITLASFLLVFIVMTGYAYSNSLFVARWFEPDTQTALRITSDVIQFSKPGVTAYSSTGNNGLFSWTFTFRLKEFVGREARTVGTYEDRFVFSKLTGKFDWNNGEHRAPFNFRYPGATFPEGTEQSQNPNGWATLQKLPDGTVAQLAISLDRPMTHDEYFKLIKKYDVTTSWLAIDTGVEKELAAHNQVLGNGRVFGYAPDALNYGENGEANFTIAVNGEGERRAKAYMNEFRYLIEHPKWTRIVLASTQMDPEVTNVTLEQRYAYLQKNGVKIYGAVLTGPTKELLKLQGDKDVNSPFVGSVDWWNWDQQNAIGKEFSY